ncbi:hypothetical protein T02_9183 [Trichinella nativa]|nr:hypothetical protein T02_9183 [Trichinella nativa]
MKNYFSANENRLQQLFSVMHAENVLQRYHLPRGGTGLLYGDALQTEVELNLDGEERQAAIDDWALCRQNYRVRKSRARARMIEARREGPIGSCSVSAGLPAVRSSNGRLPEITLPKFTGKVLEFPSFWAQFEANVHKRRDLDNATKFTYLLSNTEGTARNAIEGIPLTPENYSQAVDILKKRFGRPRQVIREHLAALWREPACREMTAQGIQSLVDEVTKHLRCLTALDKDPFAGRLPASEVLMPMLLDKFPHPALIRAWDTNIGPDAAEEEDNLQKFLEFAQWQAGLLSKSRREETKPSASRPEERTPSSKPLRPERRSVDRIRSTAAALAVAAAKGCPFCSEGHKAAACEKFQQADLSGRRDMARTKETGHMAKGCREGRPCGVDGCRQLHHKLLHPAPTTESTGSSGSDRTHPSLGRGTSGSTSGSTSGKGLQTARACAYGPNGNHVVVNCLLETGTAVSFIRKDVAKILGLTGPHEGCRFTALGGRVGPECRWRRVEFRLGAVGSSSRPDASTMVRALAITRVCGKVHPGPAESSDGSPARTVPEGGQRQGTPLMVDVLVGIDYYYELVTGRIRRAIGGSVAVETRLGWITCGRTARRRSLKAKVLSKGEDSDDSPRRKFGEVGSSGIAPAGNPAADGTVASKRLELEGSYGNLRVGKVGGCVDRERRLWRVDVRRGAVGSSGQPVASRRMGAFAIQRIREKIRQGEMDISDKSHEAAVTKMKRRQWLPIGVDVRIEIDYYFGFVTGRMRRRATGGPVALEALFGWVARGRASPRWTAEVGTFLANSGKSADVSWRKTGRIEAVKIVPEEDVPEGNKEALEKREETSTSGVEKSQRGLKKWVTGNPWRKGPGWPAEPLQARQRSPEGSGRTTRLSQVGESPTGQSELALTMDDAADLRHSTIKGNAAGVWQTSVHRQRSVSKHQSAKGKHGDAERTEGELHRTEVTRKPLVKDENPDTPVSMGHPAVPPGRHVRTETRICHRHMVVDGHMVASLESEASPRHAATTLEAKQQGRPTMDERSDVESQGGSKEVDGMCKCPPGKPGEVSDGRVTLPSGGRMFRTEQHRPSRCDLAKGWYPEVAGGQEQYPRATGQIAI